MFRGPRHFGGGSRTKIIQQILWSCGTSCNLIVTLAGEFAAG